MTFKELFIASIGYIHLYRVQLFKTLLLPFLLFVLFDVLAIFLTGSIFNLIYSIASLMLQALFAITTHRVLLLGPDTVPEWGFRKWTNRETTFSLNAVALAFFMLPFGFFVLIPIVGWFFVVLAFVILFSRLSLIFPAIAIGDEYSFKGSWALSQNYQKLMFFAVILIPVIVSIPALLISLLPYTSLITSVLSTLTIVLTVASLSVAYKFISNEAGKNS